jgi:prepilin-type N-terminal cleavage/methylation domain-containing protein
MNLNSKKGFALIEIMVVTVIISVLATVGSATYAQFTTRSRKLACVSNQNTIDKAIGMWEMQNIRIQQKSDLYISKTIAFDTKGKIIRTSVSQPMLFLSQ